MKLEKLKKTNLTVRPNSWEQITADSIAKMIVVLLAIFAYLIKLIAVILFRFKRHLYRLSIIILLFYSAYTALNQVAYAPKAEAKPLTPEQLEVKSIVLSVARYEFGESEVNSLDELVMRESSWNKDAINSSSGACGLFQALPCAKAGTMSLQDQIHFGMNYIKARYGTPSNALRFHNSHNWY